MANPERFPYSELHCAWAKIYTLSDDSGNIFYVGCTTQRLEIRLAAHLAEAKTEPKHCNHRKAKRIQDLGLKITATIVDLLWVTSDRSKYLIYKGRELEKKWILKYFELGYPLVNGRLTSISKVEAATPEFIGKSLNTKANISSENTINRISIFEGEKEINNKKAKIK